MAGASQKSSSNAPAASTPRSVRFRSSPAKVITPATAAAETTNVRSRSARM